MTLPNRELKVEENLHYVKWENQEEYVLANKGFTNWEQSLNPKTEDGVQYIGESASKSEVTGYEPNVTYEAKAYPADAFSLWVYQQGKKQIVGAQFEEVEVETWNPVGSDGSFAAYHRTYEVQPSNPGSGEAGGKITCGGTFAQVGDQEEGTFDIKTKTFTKNS